MVAQLARLTTEQFLFLEEASAASWALTAAGEPMAPVRRCREASCAQAAGG